MMHHPLLSLTLLLSQTFFGTSSAKNISSLLPLLTSETFLPSGTTSSTTGYLNVPEASIYYETYGTGPPLLFISGANGDANIWRPVAKVLASNYTVAIYDRRGFSRSYLSPTALQNYTTRLQTDATDAATLISHISPSQPATVLGTSSGALVALQLLQMYPQKLKTLILHEPPVLTVLPDAMNLTAIQQEIYAIYRAVGIPAALYAFSLAYDGTAPMLGSAAVPGFTFDSREDPYASGNWQYWFERELLQYPLHEWNMSDIGLYKDKLVLACGNETKKADPQFRSNVKLGKELGLEVVMLAGAHTGYAGETMKAWARDLVDILEKRG